MAKLPIQKPKSSLQRDLKFYYEVLTQIIFSLFITLLAGILIDRYFDTWYIFTATGFLTGIYICVVGVKKTISQWFRIDDDEKK